MAEAATTEVKGGRGGSEKLLTLTEVANRTGISMPTLQRYKKSFQSRIPSVGKGRKQRYPEEAIPVFKELKQENVKRRGRPPKSAAAGKRAPAGKKPAPAAKEGLLTLTSVEEQTGISYPTLVRYVKLHGDRIPSVGKGRSRRYRPEAVEVFKQLRAESPRGRRPKKAKGEAAPRRRAGAASAGDGDLGRRVASLEKSQAGLEQQIKELVRQLRKPLKVTIGR